MKRRNFLKTTVSVGIGFVGIKAGSADWPVGIDSPDISSRHSGTQDTATRAFLKKGVLRPQDIDNFLHYNPRQEQWAFFDPELGYRLRDSVVGDGMGGTLTLSHFAPTGERRLINGIEKSCRINTYGNSFTQCQQVSDGETWQEYLAAHIGEPIRNFGIGGYGVFQAYRRMLREETTPSSAEYVIFNIWNGDHIRSIMPYRWLFIKGWRDQLRKNDGKRLREVRGGMLHANPWAHVKIDPETGDAVEYENPYPTPESLYKLCDEGHVYESFKNDPVVQMYVARENGRFDYPDSIERLCRTLNISGDIKNPEDCRRMASDLIQECAFRATRYTLDEARDFAKQRNKKFMVLLSYGRGAAMKACRQEPRLDQPIVDYLKMKDILYVDTLEKHVEDYQNFRLSPDEYSRRYYIGHYNPRGNHFFAFAIKDAVVEWLNPKPPAYEPV